YYLAKALVDSGLAVEMITAHNQRGYVCKVVEGISVHYLPVFYDSRLGFVGRVRAFLAFTWQAYRLARRLPPADYCYASSTPLTVGVTALLLKRLHGLPFVFEVRDLWPLAPVQLGVIRNRLLRRSLDWLERLIYREAATVVALSPGIAAHVQELVPEKPVQVLPNISDCRFFKKERKSPQTEQQYGVAGKFVVTYFGAVGKVNYLQSLLEIARTAKRQGRIELAFLIVGQGNQLPDIQASAQAAGLDNVRFVPHLSKYELRRVLSVTDAVYVSFAPHPVLETSSPNKFFDALAAGKLCITNTQGWIADLVHQHDCGFYANPQDAEAFLSRIAYYITDTDALEQAQENARRLAETHFSREIITQRLVRLFVPELLPRHMAVEAE
nr:glycosyltransferase family 4 protein [Cytophagales bacterium]